MNFLELQTELDNRIAAAKVSGFWTSAMKKEWINKAGERVCSFRRWKDLELAKYTQTKKDREYYDYPSEFKLNSIYYMEVDGDEYIEKSWDDYQAYKAAGSTDKIFTSHNGFYFINPTPSENNKEITIWGIKKWVKLVNDGDEPVLPSEFDEAIVKLALATCLQKEKRYDEAAVEISEVETPANPNIPNSGGILAKLGAREEMEGPVGYIGRAKHVKWM